MVINRLISKTSHQNIQTFLIYIYQDLERDELHLIEQNIRNFIIQKRIKHVSTIFDWLITSIRNKRFNQSHI
jgi:hypothetical protein